MSQKKKFNLSDLDINNIGGWPQQAKVGFCVLLWMFLLGIWAGQTILLPTRATTPAAQPAQPAQPPAQVAPAQTKR